MARIRSIVASIGIAAGLVTLVVLWWPQQRPQPTSNAAATATGFLEQTLREVAAPGFARAVAPIELQFPRDHGPHPNFKTEWWYLTGNLEDPTQRHFGYELTFFRNAVSPRASDPHSAWSTNQAYMAHFAVTDSSAGRFYQAERFSRGALGLAGAESAPLRVWLDDWSLNGTSNDDRCRGCQTLTLSGRTNDVVLRLTLRSTKPVVLQGDAGWSQKSLDPGNASYYYSLTRLVSQGTLQIGDRVYSVSGTSWLDREWSTSMLAPDQQGWDWFALQFAEGTELMYYRLRTVDGGVAATSAGVWVDRDGVSTAIAAGDIALTVLEEWQSPATGTRYPVRWRLRVTQYRIDVELEPTMNAQELTGTFHYWEGAVRVLEAGTAVGTGYVELTGY
jgi:predicted secreted hydrolase